MARASTPTLLSLDRYARIMGLPPAPFNSGYGAATAGTFFPPGGGCPHYWMQHQWQKGDAVCREELAEEIARAEEDLASALGYWPAPVWTVEEVHRFDLYHRPAAVRYDGLDVKGRRVGIKTRWGKIIAPGRRQTSELTGVITLDIDDLDSDGFEETATISIPTTLTDADEIFVYFDGYGPDPEWEIRPARTKTITGAGNFVATFWSWQLCDPDLWEAFPIGGAGAEVEAINFSTPGNLETTVDIYRVYNDTSQVSARFYWEPTPREYLVSCSVCGGVGCEACALTYQNGCLHIRDAMLGIVVPQPATYDDDDAAWTQDAFDECRDPEMVQLWYYSGDIDQRYLKGRTHEPLSDRWAKAIAYMATARLWRPPCDCSNIKNRFDELHRDLALSTTREGAYFMTPEEKANPFGTRVGELYAWRMVDKLTADKVNTMVAGAI